VGLRVRNIAWVAGVLEGEGCFSLQLNPFRLMVSMNSTDLDVVERMYTITGLGTVYYKTKLAGSQMTGRFKTNKDAHDWRISKNSDAIALMMTVYPLMGERRQAKIRDCIHAWKEYRKTCKNGHLREHGKSRCDTCLSEQQKKSKEKIELEKLLGYR